METQGLYANRNRYGDFVQNAIQNLTATPTNVYIAVAFFTEAGVVDDLIRKGCKVRLIVRLGFPTSPVALKRLLAGNQVEIRYFTAHSFHPKIYLFGDRSALVGSANLTHLAITSNQEVVLAIDSEDPRLNELAAIFSDYWGQAKVLTDKALADYASLYSQFEKLQNDVGKLEQQVIDTLGDLAPDNITRNKVIGSKQAIFLEDFRKTYQEGVRAFDFIRRVYEKTGYRKAGAGTIPLLIEIDSFISFVRDRHAGGDSWKTTPLRTGEDQERFISEHMKTWRETPWPHYADQIVGKNYPLLVKTFGSAKAVKSVNDDELFDALSVLHSFYDRLRFHAGGLAAWKVDFLKANEPKRVREVLAYLLYGPDDIEVRMANVIFEPEYKLNEFGRANVQELIGWLSKEGLPIINGRTTKIFRYFGFDVRQLN